MDMTAAPSDSDVYRFPASFSQKAIWFIEQTNAGIRAYELANGIAIRGVVDPAAMRSALQQVTDRHEALRCTFSEIDGELWQQVRAEVVAELAVVHSPNLDAAQLALDEFLDARFDLRSDLLFRSLLLLVEQPEAGEPDAFLVLKFHHIIVDQMAIQIVSDEISACYNAQRQQQAPKLSEQPLDYADFVVWQQDNITRELMRDKLPFWTERLTEPVGCINLPLDRPRGTRQAFTGGEIRRGLRAGLSAAVRDFSQRHGVSPFTTLLAAYALTLGRYAHQDQVIVGVPFGNRGADESLQQVVGLFINTLPIPIALDPQHSFLEQVQQVAKLFVTAQANQDVPVEFILEAVPLERDPSYNPMYQVGFSFQPPPATPQLDGLQCADLELHPHASPFDIQMWILDRGPNQDLGIQVWFDDTIFDDASVDRLVGSMETLLEHGIESPDRNSRHIPLINAPTVALSGPEFATDPQRETLPELLDLANRSADQIAVSADGQSLTYAQLQQHANGVSKLLESMGVTVGQRVGILLDRDIMLLPALLGTLQVGACYVPLDPNYPRDLIAYVAQDAALAGLITNQALAEKFVGVLEMPLCCIDSHWPTLAKMEFKANRFSPQTPAYVIYTSGSTGQPKGVEISHSAAVNLLRTMLREPGISADDHVLSVTTLSFDISVVELFAPLVANAQVTIATHEETRDPRMLQGLIQTTRATIFQATPSTWRMLLEQDFQPGPNFRAFCGGEPMAPDLAAGLLAKVSALWNMYGPTEATVYATISQVRDPQRIRIGRPVGNARVYVFDALGNDVPTGVPGELYIAGAGLALGYVNRPELTAERFVAHPRLPQERLYRTGDLVRIDNDGQVEHLGRLDHQIKIRGFRVELGHIESALQDCAGVAESVVHSKELQAGDQRLIAYVVAKPRATLSINQLRKALRAALPEYMVPQFFVILDAIPRMPNGKIDRHRLPDPQGLTRSAFEPPEGELERQVAQIWCRLIGVQQIGRRDNFFAAGGHSLLAIKALSEIEAATGTTFELRALTTASLAELCSQSEPSLAVEQPALAPSRDGLFKRVKRIFQG